MGGTVQQPWAERAGKQLLHTGKGPWHHGSSQVITGLMTARQNPGVHTERGVGKASRDWGVRSEVLGLRWHVGIGVSGEVSGLGCWQCSVMSRVLRLCWEQGVGNGSGMSGAACVCTGVKGCASAHSGQVLLCLFSPITLSQLSQGLQTCPTTTVRRGLGSRGRSQPAGRCESRGTIAPTHHQARCGPAHPGRPLVPCSPSGRI